MMTGKHRFFTFVGFMAPTFGEMALAEEDFKALSN